MKSNSGAGLISFLLLSVPLALLPVGAQNKPVKSDSKTPPKTAAPILPAGKSVAAPTATNAVKPADTVPGAFVKPNRPLGAISALTFSPDGKSLAAGTYGQVVLFDTTSWQPTGTFRKVQDSARALAFHPDGKLLAIGSGMPGQSGQTVIWDTLSGQQTLAFPAQGDTIESVAYRKDGKSLLVGANDNRCRYFPDSNAKEGSLLDAHNGRVQAVAFSPKEDTIFITGAMDKIVKVWDLKSVHNVINFDQSEAGITGLAFLDNGTQFVGSSLDGRLYWWGVNYDQSKDAYNGYHFRTIGAHTGGVYCLARSVLNNRMITGGSDHAVCIWDINSGGQIRAFREATTQPIYAVALSPDGKTAAGGGRDGLIYVWDVDGNKLINTLVPPALPAASTTNPSSGGKTLSNGIKKKK